MKLIIDIPETLYEVTKDMIRNDMGTSTINKAIANGIPYESCEDTISRQAVQDYIAKYLSQYLYNDVREAVEVIDEYIGELPPVNPQPKTIQEKGE